MHITIGNLLPNTVEWRPWFLFHSPYVLALIAQQINWKFGIKGSANSNWSAAASTPFPTEGVNGSWYLPYDSKSLVSLAALSEIGEKRRFSMASVKGKVCRGSRWCSALLYQTNYLLAVNIHSPISGLTNQTESSAWKSRLTSRTKCNSFCPLEGAEPATAPAASTGGAGDCGAAGSAPQHFLDEGLVGEYSTEGGINVNW